MQRMKKSCSRPPKTIRTAARNALKRHKKEGGAGRKSDRAAGHARFPPGADRMGGEEILAHRDAEPGAVGHQDHAVLDREIFLDQIMQERVGAQ